MEKKTILSADHAEMKLRRMAYEVLENNTDAGEIVLIGIRGAGLAVAERLHAMLASISDVAILRAALDLDKQHPVNVRLDPALSLDGKVVVLVDDVTNSGKTLLYALKPLLDAYPRRIQTLVLVERSHKTYPIHPDYVGLRLATTLQEHVHVMVEADGRIAGAFIE